MGRPPVIVGAGPKMYMGHEQAKEWIARVAQLADGHVGLRQGAVELFVLPTFPLLVHAVQVLGPAGVKVGAQDLFWEDRGPFTGEVSGAELAEIGCSFVEVGHFERRKYCAETDDIVSAKLAAAFRNGLTPVLCLGESHPQQAQSAAKECIRQLETALVHSRRADVLSPLIVAYEPYWTIGAEAAAGADYIKTVCDGLRTAMQSEHTLSGSRIIYGGSAGTGLLGQLDDAVDGLFLGRSSHDPAALGSVLDEAASLADRRAERKA